MIFFEVKLQSVSEKTFVPINCLDFLKVVWLRKTGLCPFSLFLVMFPEFYQHYTLLDNDSIILAEKLFSKTYALEETDLTWDEK